MPVGILKLPEGLINKAGFNPEQPRDEGGKWVVGGGGSYKPGKPIDAATIMTPEGLARARQIIADQPKIRARIDELSAGMKAIPDINDPEHKRMLAEWNQQVKLNLDIKDELENLTYLEPTRKVWVSLPENRIELPEVSPKPGDIALLREIPNARDFLDAASEYRSKMLRFDPLERGELADYAIAGSDSVNDYLRYGVSSSLGKDGMVKAIDKSFVTTDKPMLLFRGVDLDMLDHIKNSAQILDRSYMSASLDKDVAVDFATGGVMKQAPDEVRDGILLKIMVPRGGKYSVPSVAVSGKVEPSEESEIILPRNTILEPVKYIPRKRTVAIDAKGTLKEYTLHEFIVRAKIPTTPNPLPKFNSSNQIQVIKAGFDPNQPRGEDGQWSESGGGGGASSGSSVPRVSGGSAPNQYKDWSRTDDVVNVLSSIAKSQKVKDAISKGIAAIVDQASGNLGGTENITNQYIDEVINNIGVVAAVTKADAKKLLKRSVDALVNLRKQPIKKAHNGGGPVEEDDPVLEVLLRIQRLLEEMDDEDEDEPVEKAGYDPDQPRDDSGQWTSSGGGLTEGELRAKLKDLELEEARLMDESRRLWQAKPARGAWMPGTPEYEANARLNAQLDRVYDEKDSVKFNLNVFTDPRAKDGGGVWGQVPVTAIQAVTTWDPESRRDRINEDQLEEIVRNFALPEDSKLYRGVFGDYAEQVASAKPGEIFELSKSASTSDDEGVAVSYALRTNADIDVMPIAELTQRSTRGVLLEVTAPKGTPGVRAVAVTDPELLEDEEEIQDIIEGEWILPRGTKLRVDSITNVPKKASSQYSTYGQLRDPNFKLEGSVTVIKTTVVKDK